jgi:hypothetical protein
LEVTAANAMQSICKHKHLAIAQRTSFFYILVYKVLPGWIIKMPAPMPFPGFGYRSPSHGSMDCIAANIFAIFYIGY